MCYERRRAEACVDESAHHALAHAGGREIVGKKEGEQKGSARGSVHWGCYYATALDIEVDPQRCCLGRRQSDFALQERRFRLLMRTRHGHLQEQKTLGSRLGSLY